MSEQGTSHFGQQRSGILGFIKRGLLRKCPSCGEAHIFSGYLKVKDSCPNCSAPVGQIRADDLPPYLTIFIVGHIIIPLLLFVEVRWQPEAWIQMIVWPSLTLAMTLWFLPYIKGGVLGLMWGLGIKGDEQH